MTPEEFKGARVKLGLSIHQTASLLDVDASTVKKWEMPAGASTKSKVNPIAARVMQWMLKGFRPPEFPETLAAGVSGPRRKIS